MKKPWKTYDVIDDMPLYGLLWMKEQIPWVALSQPSGWQVRY
jgi:hypothetical protein